MITINKMTEIIEQKLNEAAVEMPFEFKIHANEGEFKAFRAGSRDIVPKPLVNGVLISLPSTVVPMLDLKNYHMQQTLTILAPVDEKKGINDIMNAILSFVENNTGFCGEIIDKETNINYSYVFSLNMPQVGIENFGSPVGRAVPVSLLVSWQFVANGALTNNIKLTIDDESVLFLDFGATRTKVAQTDNYTNDEELRTFTSQQGLTIKAEIVYTNTVLGKKLARALFMPALDEIFYLVYMDGVSNGVAFNVTPTEIALSGQPGRNLVFFVTFVLAVEEN